MFDRNYKVLGYLPRTELTTENVLTLLQSTRNLVENDKPVGKMKNMDSAIKTLHYAKENNLKIMVVGDYDVDGVISVYELVKAFRDFGVEVDFRIPNRIDEGYGINLSIVKEAYSKGYSVIVTCDNGIAADCYKPMELLDMHFIITDHHNPLEDEDGNQIIPPVEAVLDPKQADCDYKYKNICGAVVVLELIRELMGDDYINNSDFIELAALATICDVVELNGRNREIVIDGLKRLPNTKNKGMRALINRALPDVETMTVHSCGFVLGPAINASGRLESALTSLNSLLCEDDKMVQYYADTLCKANEDRKLLTESGLEEALALYEPDRLIQFIVLPSEYEPVMGIIAGRIKEKYNKPTLVCCFNEAKRYYKGSGRSTSYYDMFKEVTRSSKYLVGFGGHPAAVGFSVLEGELESFKRDIEKKQEGHSYDIKKEIRVDLEYPINIITPETVEALESLGPFGSGNPRPQFMDSCILSGLKRVGKKQDILNMTFKKNNYRYYGVNFRNADEIDAYLRNKFGFASLDLLYENKFEAPVQVVYTPAINDYNNRISIKLQVESII